LADQTLRLEIVDFKDVDHWRWVLTDANGAFLADHSVALNRGEPEYAALFDLPAYLHQYAAPDKRAEDEHRLMEALGAWIGTRLLGPGIAQKLAEHAHTFVAVRVVVPPQATLLLLMPFEIAHAGGKPLARQGISLVFDTAHATRPAVQPVGDRLRMLAVFSLPPRASPLNLRRERQMLRALMHRLAGTSRLAIDLRVLQYGVTRERLRKVLVEGEGWDVIHFSGHGLPGSLVLELPNGNPDLVPAEELSGLLRQAATRLKLVTLSACLSAAASIEQTLAWLGIDAAVTSPRRDTRPATPEVAPTVARALVETLDCAVLAMRYAVEDEFAIVLAGSLYEGMFDSGQPLTRATHLALSQALGGDGIVGALSAAAPALFGARALELKLVPPKRASGGFQVPETGLAYFPPEPSYFVGRVAAMTRASAALAADSRKSGVLFHGMAGGGKTSCAVELAYHHEAAGRFQAFVWYEAPEQGKDIVVALRDFALAMECQLPGLEMVHLVDSADALRNWLPRLTELLEHKGVLLVLDNFESLLTDFGQWHDPRWGLLIDALLASGGLSRTVLTSRIPPATLPAAIEMVAVHSLSLDEALLLVRELPNLRLLLDGTATEVGEAAGRELVRRTLRLMQGHPKLLELADRLARDPGKLAKQLAQADVEQGAGPGDLDAFFREGETRLGADSFLASLRNWTSGIARTLPGAVQIFFRFLCALEEGDRVSLIIEGNWGDLWRRLGQPEPAPAVANILAPLVGAALVEQRATGTGAGDVVVSIHPGVAETTRAEAGAEFQAAVDAELAAT
jgi:hypothetical protein